MSMESFGMGGMVKKPLESATDAGGTGGEPIEAQVSKKEKLESIIENSKKLQVLTQELIDVAKNTQEKPGVGIPADFPEDMKDELRMQITGLPLRLSALKPYLERIAANQNELNSSEFVRDFHLELRRAEQARLNLIAGTEEGQEGKWIIGIEDTFTNRSDQLETLLNTLTDDVGKLLDETSQRA